MKAAVYDRYGPPEVVSLRDIDRPGIKPDQVLVEILATSVTTADWRVRASAFPGGIWLMGRLMMGLFSPRHKVLGSEFAGRVVETGKDVTRFSVGDPVFGMRAGFGAHAEYLAIGEKACIATKPDSINFDEAAAIPFGALCALVFLRDFAKVQMGWKVLVAGASGGVGVYAVQIAKHLGAEVTAVCSASNRELVRSLGADHLIDYRATDFTREGERYDLIFDTAGTTSFARAKKALKPQGTFLPLEFGLADAFRALTAKIAGGPGMLLRVSGDSREDLETVSELIGQGALKPVIDSAFPLDAVIDAYRRVETRHKTGSVVLRVAD